MMNNSLNYIDPKAKIGQNVHIGKFTCINGDVEIGDNTWISSNVTIMDGARIGENCRIFPGAVISAIPQDLKFNGEESLVVIGNNTTIRECVTINRGTFETGKTVIGNNCLLMAYVHIAHDCIIHDNSIIVNAVQMAGHIEVGEHAIIGGSSAIHQFVKIGAHAFVAGGSLVSKDVPPFAKVGRSPLRYVGINSVGLRRRGFSNDKINHIQNIYRNLFLKGFNTSQALEIIELEMPATSERDEVLNFIKSSTRGIVGRQNGS